MNVYGFRIGILFRESESLFCYFDLLLILLFIFCCWCCCWCCFYNFYEFRMSRELIVFIWNFFVFLIFVVFILVKSSCSNINMLSNCYFFIWCLSVGNGWMNVDWHRRVYIWKRKTEGKWIISSFRDLVSWFIDLNISWFVIFFMYIVYFIFVSISINRFVLLFWHNYYWWQTH